MPGSQPLRQTPPLSAKSSVRALRHHADRRKSPGAQGGSAADPDHAEVPDGKRHSRTWKNWSANMPQFGPCRCRHDRLDAAAGTLIPNIPPQDEQGRILGCGLFLCDPGERPDKKSGPVFSTGPQFSGQPRKTQSAVSRSTPIAHGRALHRRSRRPRAAGCRRAGRPRPRHTSTPCRQRARRSCRRPGSAIIRPADAVPDRGKRFAIDRHSSTLNPNRPPTIGEDRDVGACPAAGTCHT